MEVVLLDRAKTPDLLSKKRELARKLYSEGESITTISRLVKINRDRIAVWVNDLSRKKIEGKAAARAKLMEKIKNLYISGLPQRNIARQLGINLDTVHTYLKEMGCTNPDEKKRQTEYKRKQAVILASQGKGPLEIADILGISLTSAYVYLKDAKESSGGCSRLPRLSPKEVTVVELRLKGYSLTEIARKVGAINGNEIYNILIKEDVVEYAARTHGVTNEIALQLLVAKADLHGKPAPNRNNFEKIIERRKNVQSLYISGMPWKQMAKRLGVATNTLSKDLKEIGLFGVPRQQMPNPKIIKKREEKRERARKLAADGMPVYKIAGIVKSGNSTIKAWIEDIVEHQEAERAALAKKLFLSGVPLREICRQTGVSYMIVKDRYLKKYVAVKNAVELTLSGMFLKEVAKELNKTPESVQQMLVQPEAAELAASKLGTTVGKAFRILMNPSISPLKASVKVNAEVKTSRIEDRVLPAKTNVSKVYDLSYREEKLRVRKMLLDLIFKELKGDVSAFTLPGTEWLFERDLIIRSLSQGRKIGVVGVEKDPSTYEHSRLNLESIISAAGTGNIRFFRADMREVLRDLPSLGGTLKKFNLVWLDWMGQVCKHHLTAFRDMLKHLDLPAVFACTFLAAREVAEVQELYRECLGLLPPKERTVNTRNIAIPVVLTALARVSGFRSKILISHSYHEDGGAPMILVVMKITRNLD